MIPARSVRRVDSDDPAVPASQGSLPVAEFVTEIYNQPIQQDSGNGGSSVQVEVVPDYTDDGFDTPSAQSFVTEENQMANNNLQEVNSITGNELLLRLKEHRKKATTRSGIIGGVIGLVFLGPLGALGIGAGSAFCTKSRLKRREKTLRQQLEGRLEQPLPVLSSPHKHCYRSCYHSHP